MSSPNQPTPSQFYKHHVFICTNERTEGHPRGSCARACSVELRSYMKNKAKELGLEGVRINSAGCLDRCELGPIMVIYPEAIWYSIKTKEDVDAILNDHLSNGEPVEHLRLSDDQ